MRRTAATLDELKLPTIIRTGMCGHHRRLKRIAAQPARVAIAKSARKTERRASRKRPLGGTL